MRERSAISDRLRDQRLLVTGATGLLGKVFVEKLLRSAPQVGQIYLLIRKRADGVPGEQRLEQEILKSPVFGRLRALLGPRFDSLCREKLSVISGDLTHDHLGLSDEDHATLVREVDIIVNSAAAVTFDERLDVALDLNALGPTRLLALSRECNNAPLMHVSTCYVSGRRTGSIPEAILGPIDGRSLDIDKLVDEMRRACKQVRNETQQDGDLLRQQLIARGMAIARKYGWNDTYTFTKWISEQLLVRDRSDVPLVLLRPAIIESSFEEPIPGWIDGLRMADPMIMAFGRGKLTEFPADPNIPIDLIPVDLVAAAMIAALPVRGESTDVRIYQVGSSQRNPLFVSELARCLRIGFSRRPMTDDSGRAVTVGDFKLVRREDFLRKWRRKKLRLAQLHRVLEIMHVASATRKKISTAITQVEQIIYFANIYSPYTHLDCRFLDDNLQQLAQSLTDEDRAEFPFDVAAIDWSEYLIDRHIPGLRKFVLGGSIHSAPSRSHQLGLLSDDKKIRQAREQTSTIFQAFERIARISGQKTALQISRKNRWLRYTYDDALGATVAIARRFAELGLLAGDRVAICGANGPEWGLSYLATMRAGLTAVPLDPQLSGDEVVDCARFAEVKLILAGPATLQAIETASRKSTSDQDQDTMCQALPVIEMSEPFIPAPGASRDPGPLPAEVKPHQIASILFTSGTTVSPKAVALTHSNLLANARSMLQVHPLRSDESFVSVLPMYHAFEFTAGFLTPMLIGATITYVDELKGPEITAAMRASGATIMAAVPRLLKVFGDSIHRKVHESGMLARAAFKTFGFLSDRSGGRWGRFLFGKVHRQFGGRFRMFISGGSALDPQLHAEFTRMGFEVCEGYGLTETAPVLTVNPPGGGKAGSTGPALPGVELEIRNTNNQGIGELWARGPNVMSGYLKNPQATEEILRDGWLRTGDLCRCDADGYYYITGRVKDMIVTEAGKNVYPDEVEVRYKNLPYVMELCVFGMQSAKGFGESVHAVIVPDYDNHPEMDPSTIQRGIRNAASSIAENIPAHQRIETLHFWNTELPKTSTLKAKRSQIREIIRNGAPDTVCPDTVCPDTVCQDGRSPDQQAASPRVSESTAADDPQAKCVETQRVELTDSELFIRKLLANLTKESESAIHAQSNLLLDLGVDSLMKLQLASELEAHFDLTCSNETASSLARVGDVFALVGNRPLSHAGSAKGRSWRERQEQSSVHSTAATPNDTNGRLANLLPTMWLPTRWVARGSLALLFRSYIRVRASGVDHLPADGPFIIAPNHSSHLDSVSVLTAVARRRRVWVAGAEDYFFNTRLKSWVFGQLLDTIPFDRHSDGFEGLARCIKQLESGDGLLFFPEGTRCLDGQMADFKIGAALMAVEASAPIIPTRIDHAFELLPKGRRLAKPGVIRVTFGEPMQPQPWKSPDDTNRQYALYRELSKELQSRVEQLGPVPTVVEEIE